jgi:predicted phage tail protein
MGFFSKVFDFVGDIFNEVVEWFVDIPDVPQYDNQAQGVLLNKQSNLAQIPVVYGRRKIGGTRVFVETSGSDNEYLYVCLVLCEGEIESIDEVYINDVLSTDSKYSGLVSIDKKLGSDTQTASTVLTPASSWTTSHTLKGVAYLGLRFKWDRDVFSGIPEVTAVVKGKKVYDPRTSTTAYRTNPAICLLDYLTNTRYGKGLPSSAFESGYTSWQTAANKCDQNVTPYSGGTDIDLFSCNAVLDVSKSIIDNVKILLSGMQGQLVYTQGIYKLIIEDDYTASYAFTEDNILGGITVNGEKRKDRYNRVIATFANPSNNWQQDQVEYPEAGSSTYTTLKAEDAGFELETRISLDTCTSIYQARNLAYTLLYRSRSQIKCSFLATIDALQVAIGDVVTVTHSSLGWSSKKFRVTGLSLQHDGNVGVSLHEHDATIYPWYEGVEITAPAATTLPDPFSVATPTSVTVASGENYQITNDNGSTSPRMYVNWSNATDSFVDYYLVQIRVAGGTPTENPWEFDTRAESAPVYISGVKSGVTYDVRVKSVNSAGVSSSWVQVDDHSVAALVGGAIGGVTTFSQAAAPTADLEAGDIWFDTDDNNKVYRYSGTAWVAQSGNLIGTTVTSGLSDISANMGTLTAGKIQNADSSFIIDLALKKIYIA